MTAGQIAKSLGVNEVTVNYMASDILSGATNTNPLEKLEFTKHKGNFTNMKLDEPVYDSEEYFPKDIEFIHKSKE